MAYAVEFSGPARRGVQGIPPRIVPAIIEFAFGDLASEPHRVGKPLERELTGLFGARRGPYRLLYRIDDELQQVQIASTTERMCTARAEPRWTGLNMRDSNPEAGAQSQRLE